MTLSCSNDTTTSAALGDLRAVLAGAGLSCGSEDARARQQAALLVLGRRASGQCSLQALMQDAVALVADVLSADLLGVAELGDSGKSLKLAVGSTGARGNAVGTAAHECPLGPANSLAGHAIAAGHPITTTDLAADARFSDRFLSRMGVASALAVPLHVGRKAVAALCVYRKTRQEFTLDDVRFAETIGHLASVSLAQAKSAEELRQLRSLASAVLETVDSLVLTLDGNGNIVDMNGLCEQLSEYSLDEIRGRPFWSALVAGEEAEAVKAVFRDAFAGDLPQGFEAELAGKHDRRCRIAWSWRILFNEQGEADRLVLAGTRCGSRPVHGENGGKPHGPFQPVGKKPARDLRRSPRRSFHYIQRISPTSGEGRPSKKRFIEVRCEDISAGGIAFYLGRRPDFTTLVVTLGRPPAESHFSARVVRVAKATLEGRGVYLVGCRFTGRVSMQAGPRDSG